MSGGMKEVVVSASLKRLSNILMFFFSLAWESRIRLPTLLTICFMVLDIRLQLEININMGQ